MSTLQEIEQTTKPLAQAREALVNTVADLNAEIDSAKRRCLPRLRKQVQKVSEHHATLTAAVEAAPELFVKPRTVVFHGIKLGYQKNKGSTTFDDEQKSIELIKKKLPDLADKLIVQTEKISKSALAQLSVAQLKSIGATVVESTDQVLIKPTDSAVDKMVSALIAEATEEVEA